MWIYILVIGACFIFFSIYVSNYIVSNTRDNDYHRIGLRAGRMTAENDMFNFLSANYGDELAKEIFNGYYGIHKHLRVFDGGKEGDRKGN